METEEQKQKLQVDTPSKVVPQTYLRISKNNCKLLYKSNV